MTMLPSEGDLGTDSVRDLLADIAECVALDLLDAWHKEPDAQGSAVDDLVQVELASTWL